MRTKGEILEPKELDRNEKGECELGRDTQRRTNFFLLSLGEDLFIFFALFFDFIENRVHVVLVFLERIKVQSY